MAQASVLPDTLQSQASGERPLRIEAGLEARRQRYAPSTATKVAMAPVRLLQLPFVIINVPFERWLIRKKPPLPVLVGMEAMASLARRGVSLQYGGLGTGSGAGGGVGYRLPTSVTGPVNLRFFGGMTNAGYEQYYVQLDSDRLGPMRFRLRSQFFDRPEEDLFGVGLTSRIEDRSTYKLETSSGTLEAEMPIVDHLHFAFNLGVSRTDVASGRDEEYPTAQEQVARGVYPAIEGLDGRFDFLEYGASLAWDRRDNPVYAHRGSYVRFSMNLADGLRRTENAYTKYGLELQQFVPLPGVRRTLVMRLYGVITDNRSSGEHQIPVFRLEHLGGATTMRGLQDFRFIDKDLLIGNFEYRFPFWFIEHESGIAMDALAFFDVGTVMPNIEEVQERDLRSSAGFGFRLVTRHALLFRLDMGWTSGDSRLDVGIRGPI